jgi:protein TonB
MLVVLVVVPLLATDVLPSPRSILTFEVMPALPAMPPAPELRSAPPAAAANELAAPVVAPELIRQERGIVFDEGTIAAGSVDGLIGGLGMSALSPEALPPTPVAPPEPIRPGGVIKPPARIKYVAPDYSAIARANRIQGVVIIEAVIGIDGKVQDARVLRGVMPLLDRDALQAVREWEYTPTLLNGRPTPVIMTVTVRFTLAGVLQP